MGAECPELPGGEEVVEGDSPVRGWHGPDQGPVTRLYGLTQWWLRSLEWNVDDRRKRERAPPRWRYVKDRGRAKCLD